MTQTYVGNAEISYKLERPSELLKFNEIYYERYLEKSYIMKLLKHTSHIIIIYSTGTLWYIR